MGRTIDEVISYIAEVLGIEDRKSKLESTLSKYNNCRNSYLTLINSTQNEVFSEPIPESITNSSKAASVMGYLYIGFIIFIMICTFAAAWKQGDGSLIGTVLGGGIIGAIFVLFMIALPIGGLLCAAFLLYCYTGIFRESYESVLLIVFIISCVLTVLIAICLSKGNEENKQSDMSDYSKRQNDFEKNKKARLVVLQQELNILNGNISRTNEEYKLVNAQLEKFYGLNILKPDYRNARAEFYLLRCLRNEICFSLSGTDGAYNWYELHGKLDLIHDDIINELRRIYSAVVQNNRYLNNIDQHIFDMLNMQSNAFSKMENSISNIESNSDAIAELEKIRMEQEKRYMDYQTFVTRQKRMDDGHLW